MPFGSSAARTLKNRRAKFEPNPALNPGGAILGQEKKAAELGKQKRRINVRKGSRRVVARVPTNGYAK